MLVFFFFQAEDGIRDKLVTGVQTCALPIFAGELISSWWRRPLEWFASGRRNWTRSSAFPLLSWIVNIWLHFAGNGATAPAPGLLAHVLSSHIRCWPMRPMSVVFVICLAISGLGRFL